MNYRRYDRNRYANSEVYQTVIPQIVVYDSQEDIEILLSKRLANGAETISVVNCLPDDCSSELPYPSQILEALETKIAEINCAKKRAIVVGLDAYLLLQTDDNIRSFINSLFAALDQKYNASFVINYRIFDSYTNMDNCLPKYVDSNGIVGLTPFPSSKQKTFSQPSIIFSNANWDNDPNAARSFHALLDEMGKWYPTGNYKLLMDVAPSKNQRNDRVKYWFDPREFAKNIYQLDPSWEFKAEELASLLTLCQEKNQTPQQLFEETFGKDKNLNATQVLQTLLKSIDQTQTLWQFFLLELRKKLDPKSYLFRVLSTADLLPSKLTYQYVVGEAVNLLHDYQNGNVDDEKLRDLARERCDGITKIQDCRPLLAQFIAVVSSEGLFEKRPSAVELLNCNSDLERVQLVKIVSKQDLIDGVNATIGKLFPSLSDYFSPEIRYENESVSNYFKKYRRLKIKDYVTEEFVQLALDAKVPLSIKSRDFYLQQHASDLKTALLVVDGMGAEYYPLLLAKAKRLNIGIVQHCVASVIVPSSTEFNPINWDSERRLDNIKELDNIAHNGKEKGAPCDFAENIVAFLNVFEDIFVTVKKSLSEKYERVVVTADHGASRLAVLAHNLKLDQTIKLNIDKQKIYDWRYVEGNKNSACPVGAELKLINKEDVYWVALGYNRFSKQGKKINELHGGGTLEERLVPFIVFSNQNDESLTVEPESQKEFIEEDFDI